MAGQLRTFLDPEVQIGYSEQLHHKGYEYFLSTDQYMTNHLTGGPPVISSTHDA